MNVGEHIRIFELNPSDDFVMKREAAVRDLATQYGKIKTTNLIIAASESILDALSVDGISAGSERDRIAAAIKKQSASFVAAEHELEIGTCGLLALSEVIASPSKVNERLAIVDLYAMSVWSALSFLPSSAEPKVERLRLELIEAARLRIMGSGLELRERRAVSPFKTLSDGPIESAKFTAATQATIDALRYNAALDREEIDILWWILAGASTTFRKPLSCLPPYVAAIAAGYELGGMMRTLPGEAHRNLVFRALQVAAPVSLSELLENLGEHRQNLADAVGKDEMVRAGPLSFPLLNALVSGAAQGTGSDIKRTIEEWTARTLLESSIVRLQWEKSSQL